MCPEQHKLQDDFLTFCVPQSLDCPVNDIVEQKHNPVPLLYKKGPETEEGKSFFYTTKSKKRALAELRLSEDSVCAENNHTNISEGREDSEFLRSQRKRCGPNEQDQRFIPIVSAR